MRYIEWGGAKTPRNRENVCEGKFAKGDGGENVREGTFAKGDGGENVREGTFAKGDGGENVREGTFARGDLQGHRRIQFHHQSARAMRKAQGINITNCDVTTWSWVNLAMAVPVLE